MSRSVKKSTSPPANKRARPSVFDLSPPEKLQLVEDLWDDLASAPNAIPVPEWHKTEIERRQANLERFPAAAVSWEEMRQRIVSREGR